MTDIQAEGKDIAICFYGLTRSLKYTIDSITNNIFKILDNHKYKYDIYLHTYNLEIINNDRSSEKNCRLDLNEYKLLKPDFFQITNQDEFDKTINITDYIDHGDPWMGQEKNKYTSLKNILRQFNSLNIVTNLWINKQPNYKCVIYLRPDLKYITPLNIDVINFILEKNKPIIFTPNWCEYGGKNDRFSMGTPSAMKIYGTRLSHCYNFSKMRQLHSEQFLKYVLKKSKVITKPLNMKAIRIRANGSMNKKDKQRNINHLNDTWSRPLDSIDKPAGNRSDALGYDDCIKTVLGDSFATPEENAPLETIDVSVIK